MSVRSIIIAAVIIAALVAIGVLANLPKFEGGKRAISILKAVIITALAGFLVTLAGWPVAGVIVSVTVMGAFILNALNKKD